jgi:glycosyltransferase involved in cell wall biosynthesis
MRDTNAHLLIVGDGTQKAALMHLCETLNMADRVCFTGYISVTDGLPEIYRMAHLFVMASELETQGIVLLEAAASGLPIVAARATCTPEIVHNGVNGFLVEPDDLESFSDGIRCLLNDPQKAKAMGQSGSILAQEHEIQHSLELHELLYSRLIQEAGASRTGRILPKSSGRTGLQNIR